MCQPSAFKTQLLLLRYIICLKQFVKQCISGYELSTAVEKMMSSDLLHVHDQFVRVLSQSCQLVSTLLSRCLFCTLLSYLISFDKEENCEFFQSTVSRSVEDILLGNTAREQKVV